MRYIIMVVLVFFAIVLITAETLFLRDPAISPDGKRMAFAYNGDIWIYTITDGALQHLTDNIDYEYRPLWSPDGSKIAFTSNRYSNYDVYVTDVSGGVPTRLTWNSLTDAATDWASDGRIYVMTYRDAEGIRTYSMKPDGSDYRMTLDYKMQYAKSDGKGNVLFFDSVVSTWQKGYTGNAGGRILLLTKNGAVSTIIKDNFMNINPVWGAKNAVYYISNRNGTYGIWKYDNVTKKSTEVLKVPNGEVKTLYASPDGRFLSFQYQYKAAMFDTQTNKLTILPINLIMDEKTNNERTYRIGSEAIDEVEISPDGKHLLFVTKGDIIYGPAIAKKDAKKKDAEEPSNLTDSDQWESDAVWSPDNKTIACVTTQFGGTDIALIDAATKKITRITKTDALEYNPVFSPDGTMLAYIRSFKKLILYSMKTGIETELLTAAYIGDIVWRPDSKALVFSAINEMYDRNVIVAYTDGYSRQVSLHPEWDRRPVWNDDGTKLYWLSSRYNDQKVIELSFADKDQSKNVDLRKDDDARVIMKQRAVYSTIDPINDLVWLSGESALAAIVAASDGKNIVKIPIENGRPDTIAYDINSDWLRVSAANKRLYYLSRNRCYSIILGGGSMESLDMITFKTDNKEQQFREIFEEAWALLRERFYDKNMHGKDWEAIRSRYVKLLPHVRLKSDLYLLIRDMLGELNASHLGIWGKEEPSQELLRTTAHWGGRLTDRLVVDKIYTWGPADGIVIVGDRLTAIQGVPVKTLHDVDRLLADRKGKKTQFTFDRAKTVTIECLDRGEMFTLNRTFDDYLNRRFVTERTGNDVAYIHLHAMTPEDFNQFKEELGRDAMGKKGLIIDVRDNTGGRIAEWILEIIERDVYAFSQSRESGIQTIWPSGYAWAGPIVVLTNEASFSNAEIFPAGFKALKLGTVIGTTTAGGVIGTNDITLVDGTTFRIPHVKWTTFDGKNMENLGIKPDIEVDRTPADELGGKDPQLERAIQEILKQIKL